MADDTENMNLPDLANQDQDVATQGSSAERAIAMDDGEEERNASDLEAVFDIPVHVSAILGKSYIEVSELLKLDEGTIIELDRKVGEAIDIYVNDRLVARGEVVVVEERLGVTMTEIIKSGIN
ncbi:MAG: flagellar motor switch protein FliN [Parvibaculaceae bacterium]|nr:flagellar motor switch protein FliN [Parvibaculaceae bacterium]